MVAPVPSPQLERLKEDVVEVMGLPDSDEAKAERVKALQQKVRDFLETNKDALPEP